MIEIVALILRDQASSLKLQHHLFRLILNKLPFFIFFISEIQK